MIVHTHSFPGWKAVMWLPDGTPYVWSPIDVGTAKPLFSDEAKRVAKIVGEWSDELRERDRARS